MGFLKRIFSSGPKTDYTALLQRGAVILDVRSTGEYRAGHIAGSVNIPLDQLRGQLARLQRKDRPIITCCASGVRSASAKALLKASGYAEVYNGGGWTSLRAAISS